MLTKFNNHGDNLAHGTLGHGMVMTYHGVAHSISRTKKLKINKTNVQYENILAKGECMWYGRETRPKSKLP